MSGRYLKKGLIGAANAVNNTVVPMMKEEQRAKNQLNLQEFRAKADMSLQESRQKFTANQNSANQAFTAGENEQNRSFRASERAASETFTKGENDRNRELDQQRINNQTRTTDQAVQLGQFTIEGQQQMADLRQDFIDADTPEIREELMNTILGLSGKEPGNRFRFTKVPGETEFDPERMVRTDQKTGRYSFLDPRLSQIMDANPSWDESKARAYLDTLGLEPN